MSGDLSEGQMVRGVIQAGKHMLPFGPIAVGRSAEWAFDSARVEELRQTVSLSGGRELLDLKDAWQSPPVREFKDIRHWLLMLAMGLMLSDALITRMGWKLPEWAIPQRTVKVRSTKPAPMKTSSPKESKAPAPVAEPVTPELTASALEAESEKRRARFARAKRDGR